MTTRVTPNGTAVVAVTADRVSPAGVMQNYVTTGGATFQVAWATNANAVIQAGVTTA